MPLNTSWIHFGIKTMFSNVKLCKSVDQKELENIFIWPLFLKCDFKAVFLTI